MEIPIGDDFSIQFFPLLILFSLFSLLLFALEDDNSRGKYVLLAMEVSDGIPNEEEVCRENHAPAFGHLDHDDFDFGTILLKEEENGMSGEETFDGVYCRKMMDVFYCFAIKLDL